MVRSAQPTAPPDKPFRSDTVSDATRYLCVGAHLDEDFSTQVVKELFGQTLRAVAPSYGFDVRPVALHCLAARQHRRIRDLLLCVVALAMFFIGAVPAVSVGLFWWIIGWLLGALRDGPRGLRRALDRISVRTILLVIVVGWLATVVATIWASIITLIKLAVAQPGLGSASTGAAGIPPAQAAILSPLDFIVGIVVSGLLIVGGWAVLYVVVLSELIVRRGTVMRNLRPKAFEAQPEPSVGRSERLQRRLDAITRAQLGNATVYSGFDPFVGAGVMLPGWSFAMPIKADPHSKKGFRNFSVIELVDHVRERTAEIAAHSPNQPHERRESKHALPQLVVFDHVFVSTDAIHQDDRFLPNSAAPPRQHLRPQEVEEIAGAPRGPVRHYLAARVPSWGGDIVAFVFFHFSTDGEKLYFECVKQLLPPTHVDYGVVDTMTSQMSTGQFFRLAAEAAAKTVPATVGAPVRLISDLLFDLRGDSPPTDTVVDYGARYAVRELGADDRYQNYFQRLDVDKHMKIVERQVLECIVRFLGEHGVDTAEFGERQVWILNQTSISVTGDYANVGPVATGSNANAAQNAGPATTPPSGPAK
jgi:hypothetical protein